MLVESVTENIDTLLYEKITGKIVSEGMAEVA